MKYDQFASTLAADYEMFTAAITGYYLSVGAAGSKLSPRSVAVLKAECDRLATRFLEGANANTAQYLADLNAGDATAALDTHRAQFMFTLTSIVIKNVEDVINRLKGGDNNMKSLMVGSTGAIGQLLQRRFEKPSFESRDASGRKWKSLPLVRVVARDFAYQSFVDAEVADLKMHGFKVAEVVYPNSTHESHGTLVSLTGVAQGMASFAAARTTYFHPNSHARLIAHV